MQDEMQNALDLRQRALELLEAGAGRRTLMRELGVSEATARQWARSFAAGGAEAVLNAGAHRKVYDAQTKLAVAKDHVDRGKSLREVMVKYQVLSESAAKSWCRAYRQQGASALKPKRRGRKPRA